MINAKIILNKNGRTLYYENEAKGYDRLSELVREQCSPVIEKFVKDNAAEVEIVGQSFIVAKPGFYKSINLKDRFKTFDTIFFTEAGTYSFVSVYDNIRSNGDAFSQGIFGPVDSLVRNNTFNVYRVSSLNSCIPGRETSPDSLLENDFAQELLGTLIRLINVDPTDKPLLIHGKHKIYICSADRRNRAQSFKKIYILRGDLSSERSSFGGTYEYYGRNIPRLRRLFLSDSQYGMQRFFPNFGKSTTGEFSVFFGNIKKKKASYFYMNSVIYNAVIEFLIENKDQILEGINSKKIKKGMNNIAELTSGDAFLERFNAYLKEKGLTSFSGVEAIPGEQYGKTYIFNWESDLGEYVNTRDMGYYVIVKYNKSIVIGPRKRCGFLFVKEEEGQIRLVHSSWCQHISAWSEMTDQGYAHWEISDWLSGPFAERAKLNVKEMPAVFMGNKIKKSVKVDALTALRGRLNLIHNNG